MQLEKVKSLLVVRLSSLGDILLTTPLIRSIKKNFPQIKLDFLLKEEYYDLLRFNPHIENIITASSDKSKFQIIKNRICINNYNMVIDLQNSFRSLSLLKCYGMSIVSFKKRDFDKFLLVHFKINRLKEKRPIPVRYAQSIEGLILDAKGLELYTEKKPNNILSNTNKLVGLCPGSKHYTKMWPEEYFINLGKLLEKNDYNVVLLGGKEDKQLCERIAAHLSSAINLCNNDDILQTAADMKTCMAVYCNDSGMMHVATAVDIPVLAFFGSTVQEFGFAPYNAKNLILENNSLTCRPCTHIGRNRCPKKHFKCMKEISPLQAFQKLSMLITQ